MSHVDAGGGMRGEEGAGKEDGEQGAPMMYSVPVPSSTIASTVRMSRPPNIWAAASAHTRHRSSQGTISISAVPVFVFHSPGKWQGRWTPHLPPYTPRPVWW